MRVGGILFASFVLLGCSITQAEPSAPLGLHPEDVATPKARAEKVLKVLESANDHNARLERTEQQLFDQED
ncbi:MAG: hypothetical protein WCF10_20430 [Polyangiales bacterium]